MSSFLKNKSHRAYSLTLAISLSLFPPILQAQEEDPAPQPEKSSEKPQPSEPKSIQSRIQLINGDRLTGQPHNLEANGKLKFTSESLRGEAEFPIDQLLNLELDTWEQRQRPDTIARLQLQPRFREAKGDTLLGSLHELTPDSIKLDTWYGGIITLKRSMVQSLQIINTGSGSYYGPNNISEWSTSNAPPAWEFQNGSLVSTGSGGIGRDVSLSDKSHVSFEANWKRSMRFRLLLYSSDIENVSPDACYEINFNRTYVQLRTRGKVANGGFLGRGGQFKRIQIPTDTTRARFDIFTDRKTGLITVYIDGKHTCHLQSQSPNPTNLGQGLSFVAEERYPLDISSINISPWNGTMPLQQRLDLEPKKEATEKSPHRIILKNGDEVPGTVGKVQDGRMIVETEYTPIRIPLNRIKNLSLGDTGEKPRMYPADVRAWFHDGGHVTLRLESLKDGKLTGFSQALGDVSIDLMAFNKIDFHIYDPKYKK